MPAHLHRSKLAPLKLRWCPAVFLAMAHGHQSHHGPCRRRCAKSYLHNGYIWYFVGCVSQIALELEEEAQAGGPGAGASPAASARAFALKRVRERALAAHGWTIVPIPESVWRTLGMDAGGAGGVEKSAAAGAASPVQHARIHYLLAQLKGTLAQLQKAKEHDHQHHGCCGGGCSH